MSVTPMKKQAFLIGINDYQILPQLRYARQDAEAVAESLKQNYCFSENEVMLLTDSKPGLFKPTSRYIIQDHLEKLSNQNLDLFIFGFWGHGLFRNDKRYLCPLDVMSARAEHQGLPFDELQELLSNIRAKNTCLILDCCQTFHDRGETETLTASEQTTMENAARNIVLKRKEQIPDFQSNVAILNSCKEGQSAYEWDERKHGLFTAYLLEAMKKRSNSVMQIASYISSNIEKTALELGKAQTPFYKLEGDIVLPVNTKSSPLVTGDVFISYRHCNADLVVPVEAELKRRGISYFIDRVGVNYGMDYSKVIAQAIKACKVLLVMWTKEANDSPDMLQEIIMAKQLKKPVFPYKLGTFDITEHDSLFYQLSPLSRCDAVEPTPDSVSELLNQVEQLLTGKAAVHVNPTFNLPENSKDAVIQKPVIKDINVIVTPVQDKPRQPILFNNIQLPPLPEELTKIQADNKGREQAIVQIKDFTHESLSQANAAVAQAQAQFDAWVERKERLWKNLSNDVQQSLLKTIAENPQCTEVDIRVSTDNMSNQEYLDLLEQFQSEKKRQQAQLELERVQKQRLEKCNDIVKEFQQTIESEKAKAVEIKTRFMDEVLLSILAVLPGYEKSDAAFPDDKILEPLRLLDKYELGWRAPAAIARARVLWNQQRPCVLKPETSADEQSETNAEEQSGTNIDESNKNLTPTDRSSFEWDGTKITKFIGEETEVVIPEGTTEIGKEAFYYCDSLTSVVIPNSVTKIGECAFRNCNSLTSVVIPKGVTKIGERAFYYCDSLTSVVIPEGTTEIGKEAFEDCKSLTSVTLPEGLMKIGFSLFLNCNSLKSVVISEGLTKIEEETFEGCKSLASVSIPDSVSEIGKDAFAGCTELKEWTVSATHPCFKSDGVGLLSKDGKTLVACLTSAMEYSIPEGVTEIHDRAFFRCQSLKHVSIPDSVSKIGDHAFFACSSLTSIKIPDSVSTIGFQAFGACRSLTSVIISKGMTQVGRYAFTDCSSLTSVVIPDSVTDIGEEAFRSCSSLTSIVIPNSVKSIGSRAFWRCNSLISVIIPEGVKWICSGAFRECESLKSVTMPKSVEVIGELAFYKCGSLMSIIIPEGVTDVMKQTFEKCSSLTSVSIPNSVKKIDGSAFGGCTALKEWSISSSHPYFKSDGSALLTKNGKTLIVCRPSTKEYQIPNSVTRIGEYAFNGCNSLTTVAIPKSVSEIGKEAFSECSSLTSVTIPEDVTTIGEYMFYHCSSLTSVTILEGVAVIESGAFYECSSLTSITIPESVVEIANDAFEDCPKVTIFAPAGSKAEEYAKNNNIPFQAK